MVDRNETNMKSSLLILSLAIMIIIAEYSFADKRFISPVLSPIPQNLDRVSGKRMVKEGLIAEKTRETCIRPLA